MTAPYDAGDAPTGAASRPDPTTGPAAGFPPPIMRTLAARRRELGMTQQDIGERLGVARSTVAAWEAEDTEPSLFLAEDYARAVGYDIVARRAEPASTATVPDSPPGPVSGRSVAHSGQETASGDIVETAARALFRAQFADGRAQKLAEVAWREMADDGRGDWLTTARAAVEAARPLIAAQERAKVAAAHCPVCLHPWDTYHTEDGCRFVVNRTADPSSPGVVCYCAVPRAARAVQLARRAARPVTGEGDR